MNNLRIIGLGLIALMVFSGQSKSEVYYRLPNGTRVPESKLPSLGYVKIKGNGYIHYSKLNTFFSEDHPPNIWSQILAGGMYLEDNWEQIQIDWGNIENNMDDLWNKLQDFFGGDGFGDDVFAGDQGYGNDGFG